MARHRTIEGMANHLVISVLVVVGVLVVVAIGRAIAGSRFERQLRLIRLDDDDRLRGIRPIAQSPDRFGPGARRSA